MNLIRLPHRRTISSLTATAILLGCFSLPMFPERLMTAEGSILKNTLIHPSDGIESPGSLMKATGEIPRKLISEAYGALPLQFEANRGQADTRFDYVSRGRGYTALLSPAETVFALQGRHEESRTAGRGGGKATLNILRMRLLGANTVAASTPLERLPGLVNYFFGANRSKYLASIPTFARVRYENIYAGVDMVYYGKQRELEYDFIVAPGTDPDVIKLELRGADKLMVDEGGDLVVLVGKDELRLKRPSVYQEADGDQREVFGRYVLKGARGFGFEVGEYDRALPLVIDPVLSYSTFLGGSGGDWGFDIKVDAAGNAYVTGSTHSPNFPTTPGAAQRTFNNNNTSDVFVTKLDPSGTAAVFSTYIGGGQSDSGTSLALDAGGNVYVSGITSSPDYPTTAGAFQRTLTNQEAFVTKLSAAGDALLYSTYLGGPGVDNGARVAVDSAGDIYLAGSTYSTSFPTTSNAFRRTVNEFTGHNFLSATDGFVAKIHPAGAGASDLVYSTYIGGNAGDGADGGLMIALDTAGFVYAIGSTESTNFPTTADALQPFPTSTSVHERNGGEITDAFLMKLDLKASGTASLLYSTYLGGTSRDSCRGIALDLVNNIYLTGRTTSGDFPTTRNALQTSPAGGADAYVMKLNLSRPGRSALIYSTYLGGSADENGSDIAVDTAGNAYVTGETRSTNLPVTVGAFQPSIGGVSDVFSAPGGDAFAAKLNAAGTALVYFTYLGGSGGESASSLALDGEGNVYLTGYTFSTNFPLTPNVLQSAHGGSFDAFVARIDNPSSASRARVNASAEAFTFADNVALPNPIDESQKFVRQQYLDFLNREPDAAGLGFWNSEITSCGSDQGCVEVKRVNVSAAFFLSIEFQQTGFLVHRLYRASFARIPRLEEFSPDTRIIREGLVVNAPGWEQQLEANKRSFIESWVQRADFRAIYERKSNAEYVDGLYASAGVQPSQTERDALVEGLTSGAETRATALRKIAESSALVRQESNKAFVLMQYFGYLQRNPDAAPDSDFSGYDFWLQKLDQFGGNFVNAEMVKAFILSGEYRRRFGQD